MKITSLALLCGFNEARRFSFVDHPSNCRAAGIDVSQDGLDHTNCNPSSKRCSLVCKTTQGFQRVGAGNFRCRRNNHTGNDDHETAFSRKNWGRARHWGRVGYVMEHVRDISVVLKLESLCNHNSIGR